MLLPAICAFHSCCFLILNDVLYDSPVMQAWNKCTTLAIRRRQICKGDQVFGLQPEVAALHCMGNEAVIMLCKVHIKYLVSKHLQGACESLNGEVTAQCA